MKSAIGSRNVCPTKVVTVKTHLEPTFSEGRAKVVKVLRVLVGGDEEGDGSAGVMRIEVDWGRGMTVSFPEPLWLSSKGARYSLGTLPVKGKTFRGLLGSVNPPQN